MNYFNFSNCKSKNSKITMHSEQKITVNFDKAKGSVSLPQAVGTNLRYIIGDIEVLEEHSVAFLLSFYAHNENSPRLIYRFGLLPNLKTKVRLDLTLMDNHTIYTTRTPGLLKLVCHGARISMDEVERIELGIEDTFDNVNVSLENFYLSDELPKEFPLPNKKCVDEFGQWKNKDWPGKIKCVEQLHEKIKMNEGELKYPENKYNKWGANTAKKLTQGTGFFATKKVDGRWYLVDPDGYAYFSNGVCGAGLGGAGRVDGLMSLCENLPDRNTEYEQFYSERTLHRTPYMPPEFMISYDFMHANLYKVYGENYQEKWRSNYRHILSKLGFNTTGNHPEHYLLATGQFEQPKIPYTHHLFIKFPDTSVRIFRDFPDVLSEEYAQNSVEFAMQLKPLKNDPYMLGYFMRNEPEFNFVEDLIIADEVLYNPEKTACKAGLKEHLVNKYSSIKALNIAWESTFNSFDDFDHSIKNCSLQYPKAKEDLREYSVFLVKEYVRIPAQACKKVDPNHLNLGMRWSKAINEDMCAGWEYLDVFSINCYSFNPQIDIDFVVKAKVDLPVLIGEYHFGALDRGCSATGLKGVATQKDRANAYRMFVELCAEHPYGVGAHWFQFVDQFCLGRFDGENYQIGVIDICTQPYPEFEQASIEMADVLYDVYNGDKKAYNAEIAKIPMIGY